MDFDRIFPFIIIMAIWLVSAIRKLLKAEDAEKAAPADQKPGLMKSLMQNLAALEEKGKQGEGLDMSNYFQPAPDARSEPHEKESIIEMAEVSQPQESTISRETPPISKPEELTRFRASTIRKKSIIVFILTTTWNISYTMLHHDKNRTTSTAGRSYFHPQLVSCFARSMVCPPVAC